MCPRIKIPRVLLSAQIWQASPEPRADRVPLPEAVGLGSRMHIHIITA